MKVEHPTTTAPVEKYLTFLVILDQLYRLQQKT